MALLLAMSLSPTLSFLEVEHRIETGDGTQVPWTDGGQPWPQAGRTSDRLAVVPTHGPDGGAGDGSPQDAVELKSIVDPAINWVYGSYSIGTDALSTPIADLSASVTVGEGASERCAGSSLFTIIVQKTSSSDPTYLRIIEGEDAELAWEADLGQTEYVKAAPLIVDVDGDGLQEVLVVYDDSAGDMRIDAWSPRLTCSVTGWTSTSDSSELMWSWTDTGLFISSPDGPYASSTLGGHKPTTQPLLADLDFDGDAELVIAAIEDSSDNSPQVIALGLSDTGATLLWDVTLDKGTHPSDPAFARTDDSTGFVLLTTIQDSTGSMWVWKLDHDDGEENWGGYSLGPGESNSDSAPHVRLPGPIIANLDGQSDPEMILTIPTDSDGQSSVDGAEFVGMEIGDATEIWSFEASNGFADAPPTAVDTDGDGQHDRVCWVTWSEENILTRHGHAGCHDLDGNPSQAWVKSLERESGNTNDEIAVSPAAWMDIDGSGEPEVLVAFGRKVWAYDGEDGTVADVWGGSISVSHRTWAAPSFADIDGDATLDIVIGDTVISHSAADVRPLLDSRGIAFSPSEPDPGEEITVTAWFENAGTADTDDQTEAKLYANGELIGVYEAGTMEPVDPTGSGSIESFSAYWSGPLGEHEFELILDPGSNVTQSRRDNDAQSVSLIIVPTYNASFEIPSEPVRVDPGSSTIALPTVRSTGRLAGTWSLSIDSSSLPDGWSWHDETNGGLSGIEIGVDQTWSPTLRVVAPADALGSDTGYLGLSLTLDSDPGNYSAYATLPVEANRTRGLSLRGPDGTAASFGYGLIGGEADAWILVQNLGNADETPVIQVGGTPWGDTDGDGQTDNVVSLYDLGGNSLPALSLSAGEVKLVTARLNVPSDTDLEDSVSTQMSMCVGNGDEEECSTISLTYEASGVVADVHQRSVPASGLQWEVVADLPSDSGQLTWSLSDSGMAIDGWVWNASGSLNIQGDSIVMSGSPSSVASGYLHLDLPANSPPAFHSFSDASSESASHVLRMSLEVLQIHRAAILVTSPTEQPQTVDVEEESLVIIRLENPGNGADTYLLSHEILIDDNITEDPGVTVSFSNDFITLGAGSLTSIPVMVTLPDTTPAGHPVGVSIIMTSQGNLDVKDADTVLLQARQDHRWGFEALADGGPLVEGGYYSIDPGSVFSVEFIGTNEGNLVDNLELQANYNLSLAGNDGSTGWSTEGGSVEGVGVNESAWLFVNATIPADAWNGSIMHVSVSAQAQGEAMDSFNFSLEINRVPGWALYADEANLEIAPSGSQVELTVVQIGNADSRPYPTIWVSGENGWSVEQPDLLPVLSPGETAPLILNITPPESAQHGRAVELNIRLRDGDGNGETEITLPLRVAIIRDFEMSSIEGWVVSESGGFPIVELLNLGNAPSTISLQVLSLPVGWTVSGQTEVVLGVEEVRGVPLEIIPSGEWDGSMQTIRILAEDEDGNQREVTLDTLQQIYSWASTPIIVGMNGDEVIIDIHGADSSTTVIDSFSGVLSALPDGGWALPVVTSGEGAVTVGTETLTYLSHSSEPPSRAASCIISGDLADAFAQCTIMNGTEGFHYTMMLIDDAGSMLGSASGFVSENTSLGPINLSALDWTPEPGIRDLTVRLLDGRGVLAYEASKSFEVRRTDWNVGIVEIELEGEGESQRIRVSWQRSENVKELLAQYDADCRLTLDVDEYSMSHSVDLTGTFSVAFEISRPSVAQDGDELVVTMGCSFPWDMDSDSNDNEDRVILSGGAVEPSRYPDLATSVGAAVLVIGVSVALAWIIRNNREGKQLMEMAMSAAEEKMISKQTRRETVLEKVPEPETPVEEEAGIKDSGADPEPKPEDDFEARLRRLMRD
ncbi:MAG: FG-GAP-like repeat-containing protein [Candidatus Thermoplasmatota archaeon]|nr:FG-GAP-like repeat-containing protein [Candidatus Thermoplasmatota archaeon]